ncbi:MAG TPA: DUF2268 domain-containing putative Zn-dependent protease [Puia sp.]|nr:DUF2268 domain-containing putative Zn-dependent protease [Puia sp.]
MKQSFYLTVLTLLLFKGAFAQDITTSDITHFWDAYDKITATKDSVQQYDYLNTLFIDPGTPGLKAIMKVKRYTAKSYIDAINQYPQFWHSVRANTFKANSYAKEIAVDIRKLKKLYPGLRPAQIYFTIGALRSGGTTQGNMVLIGSELALADPHTVTSEFPATFSNLRTFFDSDPPKHVAFTNTHEYVHTQQKTTQIDNLLAQCVMEGVAEFVAVKATGEISAAPAIGYGKDNMEKIRQKFETQLFNTGTGFWLYSDAANEFGVRDLGYYVGYAVCEKYYDKAPDKKLAIKQMIELDYANENDLAAFVDASGYFETSVQKLKERYEEKRPVVISVKPFGDDTGDVSPATQQITIVFSAPMDKGYRNFELGPLGEDHLMKIKRIVGFSEDGRSLTLEIGLQPDSQYQIVIGKGFRNAEGARLKPYLIDFKTGK